MQHVFCLTLETLNGSKKEQLFFYHISNNLQKQLMHY